MGKKTTKRKTRWRALSIGEVPSDTEEESQENTSTYKSEYPYHQTHNGKPHYYQQRSNGGGGAHYGGTYKYSNYSSQSTPTRNRNYHYQHNGEKYKNSRSNSTASEPKITFNEDEYTRITTPRQDVLFKKGYLSKKKPNVAVAPTPNDGVTTSNGSGGSGAPSGGSCGDSNPSTGYSSTTGGGTPEHHSQDGGEYREGEFDQHQQFIFHNGFVESNGIYFVNAGVPPGFEYGPMMLVGPAGQFIHPMEFYPPAPGMCFPPYTYRGKRYSTDSQTESASPNNETDSSNKTANTGNECSSSSIPSSTNDCDTGNASSSCTDDQQQQLLQNGIEADANVDGVAPLPNVNEHEAVTAIGANHQGIPIGMGMGTVPPGAMFPPTQFIFPAPHPGFLPYHSNHHQIFMNGVQLHNSTSVNETVESKRYKKRRRRKISRLQNENSADADYTDETTSSSDDNETETILKHEPLAKIPSTDLSAMNNMSSEPTDSSQVDLMKIDDTNPTSSETTPTNDPTNTYDGSESVEQRDEVDVADSSKLVKDATIDLSSDDMCIVDHDNDILMNESESREFDVHAEETQTVVEKEQEHKKCTIDSGTKNATVETVNENSLPVKVESTCDRFKNEKSTSEDEEVEMEKTDFANERSQIHVKEQVSGIDSNKKFELENDSDSVDSVDRLHIDSDDRSDKVVENGHKNESNEKKELSADEQKPSLTTIYKVDAEEFVPMSMRIQNQEQTTTNGVVDEELRAKFENYLNRNAENLEKQNAFELQIARLATNSVPDIDTSTSNVAGAKQFDPKDIQEFVPRNGEFVEYVAPISKSYPPKREHFGRHEHGNSKKYSNNGAHYTQDHYSGYKKRNYNQNDRYYQRHNYHPRSYKDQNTYGGARNAKMSTEPVQNDSKPAQIVTNGMSESSAALKDESDVPTTPTGTTVSSSYSQTVSENEQVECNGEIDKETPIKQVDTKCVETLQVQEKRAKTQSEIVESTKKPTTKNKETTSTTNSNTSTQTIEPVKKPHLPPGFSAKSQKMTHAHPKTQAVLTNSAQSSDSSQSTPIKLKNYAQVVKKSQKSTASESVESSIVSNSTMKQIDGTIKADVSVLSNLSPVKNLEDEWIAVPSRKKGKSKQAGKFTTNAEYVNETSYHIPKPEPVVIPKSEHVVIPKSEKPVKPISVKSKVEKQVHSMKEAAKEPVLNKKSAKHSEKKIVESSPEKVKVVRETKTVSKKHEIVNANGNDAPIVKSNEKNAIKSGISHKPTDHPKEKRAEKVHENVKKVEEKIEEVVQIETSNKKPKKMKTKNKKVEKSESKAAKKLTNSSPLEFDIVESIDKLNKHINDDTKTNVEMSFEIDKLIQKGLYANMEQTLRSFGGDSDAFLSIVDPSLDFMSPKSLENGSISPSADKKQNLLDQHVMRTLSECQRMFAYRTLKEYDLKSSTKEIEIKGMNLVDATTKTDHAEKKIESKTSSLSRSHSDETKSSKKSKKSRQKHKSPTKETCIVEPKKVDEKSNVDLTKSNDAEKSLSVIPVTESSESQMSSHKKETLDMDTVNAILRDLSAERKRELLHDNATDNVDTNETLSTEKEIQSIECDSGSPILQNGIEIEVSESHLTESIVHHEDNEKKNILEQHDLVEEKVNKEEDSKLNNTLSMGEISQLSYGLTEDEKSICKELQSDSIEQISDLCESADISSPESNQKGSIFYSTEDLNDFSPVEKVDTQLGPLNEHFVPIDDLRNAQLGQDSVITQEPHLDKSKSFVMEDNVSVISLPDDPKSTSSEDQNISITEAVRNWLHETKEKSPEIEVLKSPEKLKLEGAGRTRIFFSSDTDDSDEDDGPVDGERVGRRTGPKNVKGNPLSAEFVNINCEPVRINAENDRGSIDVNGFDDRRVALCFNVEPETITEARQDVCSSSRSGSIEPGFEVGESFESDEQSDRKEYKITENVVNIAREIANSVNPVVNGIGFEHDARVPNGYEITENGIKVRENIVQVINGATVRDVAIIRRTVSENGAILNGFDNDLVDSLIQNDINDVRADIYVKKSKSCIEMNDFHTSVPADVGRVSSAETQLNDVGSTESDLLDCWENDLNVDPYRTSALIIDNFASDMNIQKTTTMDRNVDNGIKLHNNNVDADAYNSNLNTFNDTKCPKEKLCVDENGEDVLEVYESVYGKNIDYLEIKQKVLETAQRQIPPSPQNVLYPPGSDRVVPCGAICCNVM